MADTDINAPNNFVAGGDASDHWGQPVDDSGNMVVSISGTNKDDSAPQGGLTQAAGPSPDQVAAAALAQAQAQQQTGPAPDPVYHYVGNGQMAMRMSNPILSPDQIADIYGVQRSRLRSADQLAADRAQRVGALQALQQAVTTPVQFSPLDAALAGYAHSMGGRFIGTGGALADAAAAGYDQQKALATAQQQAQIMSGKLGLEFLQGEDKNDTARDKDAMDNLTKDIQAQQRMQMMRAMNNNGILNTPQGVVNTNYQDINGVPKVVLASPKPADLWMTAYQKALALAKDMNFANDQQRQDWVRARTNDAFAAAMSTYTQGSATSPNYGGAVPVRPVAPGMAPPVGTGGVPSPTPMPAGVAPQNFPTAPVSAPAQVRPGVAVTGKPLNPAETAAQAGVAAIANNPEPPAVQKMDQDPQVIRAAIAQIDSQIAAAPAGSKQRQNLIAGRQELAQYFQDALAGKGAQPAPVTVATPGQVLTPNNTPTKANVPGPATKLPETPITGVPQDQAPSYNPPEVAAGEVESSKGMAKMVNDAIKGYQQAADSAQAKKMTNDDLLQMSQDIRSGTGAATQAKLANIAASVGLKGDWITEGLRIGNVDKLLTGLRAERLKEQRGVQNDTDDKRETNAMASIGDAKDKLMFGLHREKEMQDRAIAAGEYTMGLQANQQNPFRGSVTKAWHDYQEKTFGPTFTKTNNGQYMFRHEFINQTIKNTLAANPKADPNAVAAKAAQVWLQVSKGR